MNYNFENTTIDDYYAEASNVIYTCASDGNGDAYRNSVIISMSVINDTTVPIYVDIYVLKPDTSKQMIAINAEIYQNTVFVPVGGDVKNILENGDSICMDVWGNNTGNVNVNLSVMNLQDFGYVPPILNYIWYGDIGFIFGGITYITTLDRFDFTSRAITAGFATVVNAFDKSCACSNETIGLILGGLSGAYLDTIKSIEFSSAVQNSAFSSLLTGVYGTGVSSNGNVHLTWGGYNVINLTGIQKGKFASGETCTIFGNLTVGTGNTDSSGNSLVSLCIGGTSPGTSLAISYVNYATQSDSMLWGNTIEASYSLNSAANEEKVVHPKSGTSYRVGIDTTDLSSLGNSTTFGNLTATNLRQVCIGNITDVLFAAGENNNYSDIFAYDTGVTATAITGFTFFDGDYGRGMSGAG